MEMEKTLETAHGRFLLRPYLDEDEERVIALWEAAFNQKMDKRIWRWKFHENPFGRELMVCFNDLGNPVALFGGIPYFAHLNGQKVRITHLIDNMTHPNFRQATDGRKGLFVQTVDYFIEVYCGPSNTILLYGFPGLKHFKLGKIFLQYSMLKDGGSYLEANPSEIRQKHLFSLKGVKSITAFDDKFDKLLNDAKKRYPFSAYRDKQFLNWRFLSHPTNRYETFALENIIGNIESYLVIQIVGNVATMVDIFGKKNPMAINKLVFQGSKILRKKGVEKIRVWLPKGHFITKSLISSGFQEKPEPLGIVPTGRSFSGALDIGFVTDNLYYTMADGDLF